ncbi:MAG TPA: hypothetical protein DGG95_01505 [Cytophagales bacterium]|jgi:hypothetical protein|nr:hypothetical protein [Cytophagales bacterium]
MATISRWIVPSYFTEEKHRTDQLIFDLTDHLKLMLKNEVWNRKFNYGFSTGLKNTNLDEIKSAVIRVFPRFIQGYVNENRVPELIENVCGKVPSHLNVNGYKKWSHQIGVSIIEIVYHSDTKNIPTKSDLTNDFVPNYDIKFIEKFHQHLAVLKELASFFLTGLHLSFPTESIVVRNDSPINDGFFLIKSGNKSYAAKVKTSAFMHEILIETTKRSNIEINLKGLSSVWHFDLWPLKRFLNAVESDQISMDNLLDLIYSLEGLFEKSASADFIKSMCILNLCRTKKDAREMKNLLDVAYRIRNDIAHGERSYDLYDYVKLGGKETLAQMIYWKMKTIVACMLIKSLSKLIENTEMRNLRFNSDDFIDLTFKI